MQLATNLACSFVKRDCNLRPILFFITKLYFSSFGNKFCEASFLHFTSLSNKFNASELASKILFYSISSLSSKEYKSSSLLASSSVPEISPNFSNRLSIIEIEFL